MTNSRQVAQTSHPLAALGLDAIEGDVYASLVAHPQSTAEEIAEFCGTSGPDTAEALTSLVARGLATRMPGATAAYRASAPDVTLGSRVLEQETALRAARDTIDHLTRMHRDASRFTHPAQLVEVISGRSNITARVGQIQSAARHQVRGFDQPPYAAGPSDNLQPQIARMAEGISYRIVYDRDATAWPGYLEQMILPLVAHGEAARVAASLPMKLFIGDDRSAIIPVTSSEHVVDAAYVVHPCALLDALITLFELEWARAVPVSGAAPGDQPEPEQIPLLTLLASGATDAGIARALGWSERTTQRRVRALMDALGTTTRFQLGLAARERGWV